jgi:signal transduction histidine kinase/DNA-binding response OmpR family regulator
MCTLLYSPKISFLFIILVFGLPLLSAPKVYNGKIGFKYYKNYTSKEYDHHPQNWVIIQDSRGIIYVGNLAGLLEFDGVSWRVITIPNLSVRSLAIDETGTIYIGGKGEIGFLSASPNGTLQYISLLNHLEDNQRNFSNVNGAHSTKEGVYFRCDKFLFRWNPKKEEMKFWKSQHSFKASFYWKERLLIQQEKVGLQQTINDSLQLSPEGETFAETGIFAMFPYNDQKLLIGTRAKGFFIYDGYTVLPFPTEADEYIKEKYLNHGIRLSGSDFALATRRGGLVIIDSRGKLKHIFNKISGLQDDDVKFVFEDSGQNIWLALNKGISKIEYSSPFIIYDDRSNLTGIVLSVVKHHNRLYVGTTNGLFFQTSPDNSQFHPIPGITRNCWSLLFVGNILFAATSDGVFQVEENNKRKIIENRSYVLHQSKTDPNRIWVGTKQGVVSLHPDPKNLQWKKEYKFENISFPIRTIVEDKKGNLWLGTLTSGVIHAEFPGDITSPVVTRYDTSHGLPPNEINVFWAAGHVMFATGRGILRFHEAKKIFIPDTTLGNEFTYGSRSVFRAAQDKNKNIWFHSEGKNYQAVPEKDNTNGTFNINSQVFLRIPINQVNAISPEPDGHATWFAANYGLIRYEPSVKKNYSHDFSTLIRKVSLINDKSLIFNGYCYRTNKTVYKKSDSRISFPVIKYKDRNLRFLFSAPFFEDESATRYQYFLDGYDEDWSLWSSETQKDYTNLHSGVYTFRARARNVYENVSREAIFKFKVLPPWYQSWWAYLAYTFFFLLGMYFIVKWRSRKLELEKQRLEQVVKKRTNEIKEKNNQLEIQTLQLQEQSEKLKEMDNVKSRFFANISHEFRTPLTLIMGPLEQMISDDCSDEKEKKRKLILMYRNAQRLLRLINQLLELSKLDSGKMKLQAGKTNIISFVKGIIASFQLLTHQNELDLVFDYEQNKEVKTEDITLYIDPRKMEDVMSNLLINALKFTPPGGEIRVTVKRNPDTETNFPEGFVEIVVYNTGPGIPAERLPQIFDRFYQADTTYEFHQKGSGIGLALSKELVELHHGTIAAKSHKGEGSAFIIRLPMGSAHLAPDEMVDIPSPQTQPLTHRKISEEIPSLEIVMEKEEKGTEPETGYHGTPEAGADKTNIILVVEDSADMRDYIRGALEPDYTVVDAKDGREGIQKAQMIIPDLIISDIMMPKVDGYELCRVLKSDVKTSHIPIILLTAKASEENILRGLETGSDDYITKPFSTKIMSARIKNLIDIRCQLQKNINREMTLQPVKTSVSKIDREFIHDVHEVINKNLSDAEFNVEELCKKLYMGRTTLYRKILALTGDTPTDFIRSYRLKRGAELLKQNFGTVLEVAFEVGFSNSSYFAKCFKEKFHQLPSAFMASER